MKLAAPVCALLLLAACGSGSGDEAETAAAQAPATTRPTTATVDTLERGRYIQTHQAWMAWIQTMPANLRIVIGASFNADPAKDAECKTLLDGLALAPTTIWGDEALTAAAAASVDAARAAYSTCAAGGDATQQMETLGQANVTLLAEADRNSKRLGLG